MSVVLKEIITDRDLKRFIKFPFKLFENCKYWVPPLIEGEIQTLHKNKNPAFEYCEAKYWMAYKNGKPAGRMAGILNHRANDKWQTRFVRFGWVDFIDDPEVSRQLFNAVENWAKERGMLGVHGPLGFTDMDNEGLLVEGFDRLPTISNIYNYPYYVTHFEQLGYEKAEDWIQYLFNASQPIPDKVQRINRLIMQKYNLQVLRFESVKEILPRAREVLEVLNAAFVNLYGFVALTDKEIDYYVKQYFSYIKPEYICFVADATGKVIGFAVSMPSLSKAMQKAKGRLFPFGFVHILKALRKNDTIDLYLNGVLPEWQNKGIHSIYHAELNKAYIRNNITVAISNPQLESNINAISAWKDYQKELYIRRRCYRKTIL
ncbi:MAG: N-acetyltransferase [Bacteroidales bacterium]|jgi:GNAT superfamily N-acetyltransferase|nr:N-acetyltransferase [Bacteroidales bacterium]